MFSPALLRSPKRPVDPHSAQTAMPAERRGGVRRNELDEAAARLMRHTAVDPAPAQLDYKIADCARTRAEAFRLIYRRYIQAGLIRPNPFQLRVTPFHLEPDTFVFVGLDRGSVVGTVSLIGDGRLGLPLDVAYAAELAEPRQSHKRLAEVSCLAFAQSTSPMFWTTFLRLNRLMAQFARHQGVDSLVAAVHPRHWPLYRHLMGFQKMGPVKHYACVQNKPAVACRLDFTTIDLVRPRCYDAIFGEMIPRRELRGARPIAPSERIFLKAAAADAGQCVPVSVT